MECQQCQKRLSAYLDGALDREWSARIEQHVRACAVCRRDLETLRKTIEILRSPLFAMEDAPERVRQDLARKIRVVRQPMSWMERLRLQWRVAGMATQARAWGYGVAITALLFFLGIQQIEQWKAPAETLSVGGAIARSISPPQPETRGNLGLPSSETGRPRVRFWVEWPVIVGQNAVIYLYVQPDRDLLDAQIRVVPAAGVTVVGNALLQSDASYLLFRGPIPKSESQRQWVPVVVRPSQEGAHTLRVRVSDRGVLLVDDKIVINATAASD